MSIDVRLRDLQYDDILVFFEHQLDTEANYMAAFTKKDPNDWDTFNKHWNKILFNNDVIVKTIIVNNEIVGYISMYYIQKERNIGYWIDKNYWGKGIATKALKLFLNLIDIRPIYARAAFDNTRSIRVLEKCGFKLSGEDKYFANARKEEIKELIYRLNN